MIKVHLGRKEKEEILRPLTEKEIQERLYGSSFRNSSRPKEESEKIGLSPPRQGKAFPKISFTLPWRRVVSVSLKGLSLFYNFSKSLLAKLVSGWGLSLVLVVSLFLGIHGLNAYRAAGMRNSKPRPRVASPVKIVPPVSPEKAQEVGQGIKKVVSETGLEPSPAPPAPPLKETPAASPHKPYVIQVCTYTREQDAARLVEKMRAATLSAFSQPLERSNGKTFHPVFLGRYATFREAQAELKEFRERPIARDFTDSFIRTL